MLPSLRIANGIAIPSYGLMLFVSFVVGIILFDRRLRARHIVPATLRYGTFWLATDILMALILLGAAIWGIVFAPQQVAFLKTKPAAFLWLFRVIVLAIAVYLEYGSIRHMVLHVRSRSIEGIEFTTYIAMWVLLSAIFGSRLLYVIMHWSEFQNDLVSTFAFWHGGLQGLMFYGGLLGALIMGVAFAASNRLSLLAMLDAAIPSIVLGEFFTRIGCFLNGCCFGQPCSLPWGVHFPANSPAGAAGLAQQAIHPTQLYSSLAGLVLFVIALILERRKWRRGMLFGVILLLYAAFRFGIDFVRYYEDSGNFWSNQGISLGLAALAIGVILWIAKRRQAPAGPSEPGV
jgi:phosphatidylglycerol---prolipoprotein diacylglyceryl transferase